MGLTEFIAGHHKEIIDEWVRFARGIQPTAGLMSEAELRDHAELLLRDMVEDMEVPQSAGEQREKSQGHGDECAMAVAGRRHASQRIQSGFQLEQLVSEFRALRASVLRLWSRSEGDGATEVTRFNEAIDESLCESAKRYTEMVSRTREQFLGMLGHDLRNPLGAILMSATMLTRGEDANDKQLRAATSIVNSARRMNRLVDDLLDLTRTRLGGGIPITPAPVDLSVLCRQLANEIEAFHPEARLRFEATGNLCGEWDGDRLSQVVSNLVANAVQHGQTGTTIDLTADGSGDEVVLRVRNAGKTIPAGAISTLFEPMVRATSAAEKHTTSLGLGLFIAREVVSAHGGKISVTSTDEDGTVFTVRLPRRSVPKEAPKSA